MKEKQPVEFSANHFEVRRDPERRGTRTFGVWHDLMGEWIAQILTKERAEDIAYYLSHGEGEQVFLMALGGDEESRRRMQQIRYGGGNIRPRARYADAKDILELDFKGPFDGQGFKAKIAILRRVGDWVAHYTLGHVVEYRLDDLGFAPVRDAPSRLGPEYTVAYKDGRVLKSGLKRDEAFALVDHMGGPWRKLGQNIVSEDPDNEQLAELKRLVEGKEYMKASGRG